MTGKSTESQASPHEVPRVETHLCGHSPACRLGRLLAPKQAFPPGSRARPSRFPLYALSLHPPCQRLLSRSDCVGHACDSFLGSWPMRIEASGPRLHILPFTSAAACAAVHLSGTTH